MVNQNQCTKFEVFSYNHSSSADHKYKYIDSIMDVCYRIDIGTCTYGNFQRFVAH